MKKKILALASITIAICLFVFGYIRVNEDKPRNIEIKKYEIGDTISYDGFRFSVDEVILEEIENVDFKGIRVKYNITNDSVNEQNANKLISNINFHVGLNQSIHQNTVEPGIPIEDMPKYDYIYTIDDLKIASKANKSFYMYYPIDEEDIGKYDSCIVFFNDLYKEKYSKKLEEDLTFYYEILDLKDIIWNFLLREHSLRKQFLLLLSLL